MAKSKSRVKRTISRDSVFRNVNARSGANLEPVRQGVPQDDTRTYQTAVWLGDEQIEWLDNQCRSIQRGGWRGVTRSSLIRALILAAGAHKIDLSGVTGEVEIAQRLASRK